MDPEELIDKNSLSKKLEILNANSLSDEIKDHGAGSAIHTELKDGSEMPLK